MNTRFRLLALIVVAAVALAGCSGNSTSSGTPADPAHGRYTGPLPPLPSAAYELPRPREVVEAVYNFAGRRPDVLRYVPCFCGCQASGHVGNDDCFVASRDTSGKPTWDAHGMG